ncbi:tRNA-(ms[2]io[6]A)-hydroxylase [Endozoicomonas sp. OPT23]|uniref:tRNA-(ms[2]io[6]A)-hydroxylase n=1 Tax=Endozoicomonas sp. OPT23 TaxID=2072845 RepID=UPI00129B4BBE|nr:tRNA isopentenyl-2-thiomethyl-A-37 hydroxylase MiaE [Endozoicomonas sp. OPT23]MRI34814.1 tRNA-(ms[2]io[6]A)-hydroxylase [Endozoicomonas sp. OPT23]
MTDKSLAEMFPELVAFLPCETPDQWIEEAAKPENLDIILIDHANNELKAASAAQSLILRYKDGVKVTGQKRIPCNVDLLNKMSRLAREELRHFEQVLAIMTRRNIEYTTVKASRYASRMLKHARTWEPAKLVDTLIIGAYIEARSCERFHKLAPHLDAELGRFYLSLLKSEGRHFSDYLTLAQEISDEPIEDRIALFAEVEKEAMESPDEEFRFHSGVPVKTSEAA